MIITAWIKLNLINKYLKYNFEVDLYTPPRYNKRTKDTKTLPHKPPPPTTGSGRYPTSGRV